jgi:KaiC/GvpD/RAD55 family RecA-like ATPase
MTNADETLVNPLGLLGLESADNLNPGCFGAVLARAGVGKTALIVQLALNSMAKGKNLLHISLNEPIAKVDIHYREVFDRQAQQNRLTNSDALWDSLLCRRFIMTFQVEGFSVPKLEERLTDLTAQNIFRPEVVIIDRLPFDEDIRPVLESLKTLADQLGTSIWFTITTHRHEAPAQNGWPVQLSPVHDLFDLAIGLEPNDDVVEIKVLKGDSSGGRVVIDPVTMLIHKQ